MASTLQYLLMDKQVQVKLLQWRVISMRTQRQMKEQESQLYQKMVTMELRFVL